MRSPKRFYPWEKLFYLFLLVICIQKYLIPCDKVTNKVINPNKNDPLLLIYTEFFHHPKQHFANELIISHLQNCPKTCRVSTDESLLSEASAVFFHPPNIDLSKLPAKRNSTNFVFFTLESPGRGLFFMYEPMLKINPNYFDVTMTYKNTSTYPNPYDILEVIRTEVEAMDQTIVRKKVLRKANRVLIFYSNCEAESRRTNFINQLSELIDITQVGPCSGKINNCDKDSSCEEKMIDAHLFYLALENSICDQYITEKFFKFRRLIIPVVWRREMYEIHHPEWFQLHCQTGSCATSPAKDAGFPGNMFIAVDDFQSMTELADYLEEVYKNPKKRLKYFEWTKDYRHSSKKHPGICDLCMDLHQGTSKKERNSNFISEFLTPCLQYEDDYSFSINNTLPQFVGRI